MVYRALDFVICYCLRSSTIRVHTWNCSRLPLHLGRFFDPILRKRSATQIFLRLSLSLAIVLALSVNPQFPFSTTYGGLMVALHKSLSPPASS